MVFEPFCEFSPHEIGKTNLRPMLPPVGRNWGARNQTGDNLKVVWAELSSLSKTVLLHLHSTYKHARA